MLELLLHARPESCDEMPDKPSQAAFDPLFALRIDRRAETEFFPDNLCEFLWLLAFGIEISLLRE